MSKLSDPTYLQTEQYKDSSRLNARVALHSRFSTNHYGWFRWVFDQYHLPPACRVLELGCGPADIWKHNIQRVPSGWELILSDFSPGMASRAQENLAGLCRCSFSVINAQSIPFPTRSFDAVIANHMLYHVPDRPRALAEIRRVLVPGGRLYATTVGEKHMQELFEIPRRFDPAGAQDDLKSNHEFTLENGIAQLEAFFPNITLRRYPDSLRVTEAGPLVDYILSTYRFGGMKNLRAELSQYIERELAQNGPIEITKDSGMLIASD